MKINTYNQKGEEKGTGQLPKDIFDVKMNNDLVHQVMTSQGVNRRQGTAHTKDRGEVRGGGRKPWRQKGTGRARHGSNRSPIWKGGGVTFGPRNEKVYSNIIPKKTKRKALLMVLSSKVKNKQFILLDELKLTDGKTKQMAEILKNLPCYNKSTLIALPEIDKNIIMATRNIPSTKTIQIKDINVLDILNHQYFVTTKTAIKVLQRIFKGGETIDKEDEKIIKTEKESKNK